MFMAATQQDVASLAGSSPASRPPSGWRC